MRWNALVAVALTGVASLVLMAQEPSTVRIVATSSATSSAPVRVRLTVSKETTVLTQPVNPDGSVNYIAAINAQASEGVTPENNAGVLLVRAMGPELLVHDSGFRPVDATTLKRLQEQAASLIGIQSLPADGHYFSSKALVSLYGELAKVTAQPWTAEQFPEVAKWLEENREPLELVIAASKRPNFYLPIVSPDTPPRMRTMGVGLVVNLRMTGRGLVARAMLRLQQGDVAGARADLLALHRLGNLLASSSMTITRLVGTASDMLACDGDVALARWGKLSTAQLTEHLADLQRLPFLQSVVGAMEFERLYNLEDVALLSRNLPEPEMVKLFESLSLGFENYEKSGQIIKAILSLPRDLVDWDEVARADNAALDRTIAAMKLQPYEKRVAAIAALDAEADATMHRVWKEMDEAVEQLRKVKADDAVGRKKLTQLMIDLRNSYPVIFFRITGFHKNPDLVQTRRNLAVLTVALAAYKADKGQFPPALADLQTAGLLKALPSDVFTEKPLAYKRTEKGFLLYSVGPNMKDDGGRNEPSLTVPLKGITMPSQPTDPADDISVEFSLPDKPAK